MSVESETAGVSSDEKFRRLSELVCELYSAVNRLEDQAEILQPPAVEGQEWYELLRQKLIPQLGAGAYLVVAVVGGTNIGKSVVFNHLAGCRASASSPLASGTRHPVCLVPQSFSDTDRLESVFPDFRLRAWQDADAALGKSDEHELFWRTEPDLPDRLLILDTPDIDSDTRVNWVRADAIRRSADVLIAVLTQQKYNDAAVKTFFRKAAQEDKAVIVVFNQCLLPDDESYWPVWLGTFCDETGLKPDAVYLAPSDRRAAEALELPFLERTWPPPQSGPDPLLNRPPRRLNDELSELRFREVRTRTLRGSLAQLLSPENGLPRWMERIGRSADELARVSERLSGDAVLRIRDWPGPPNAAFVRLIREWWKQQQQGWARKINGFYDAVGAGIKWPFVTARNAIQGEPIAPLDRYREEEWSAILTTVEELFDKLQWMSESGNDIIRPRIDTVLEGSSRTELIEKLRTRHQQVNFEELVSEVVSSQMQTLGQDSPDLFRFYRQLNNVSAVVRPVTSVVLFSLGFGPAGETVAPFVADAATQAVVHVVADVAGGAATAVAGEAAVSGATGTGVGLLQTWFHRLHSEFSGRRVTWLTELIREELLGTLPEDLRNAAAIQQTPSWNRVGRTVDELRRHLQESDAAGSGRPPEDLPPETPSSGP